MQNSIAVADTNHVGTGKLTNENLATASACLDRDDDASKFDTLVDRLRVEKDDYESEKADSYYDLGRVWALSSCVAYGTFMDAVASLRFYQDRSRTLIFQNFDFARTDSLIDLCHVVRSEGDGPEAWEEWLEFFTGLVDTFVAARRSL